MSVYKEVSGEGKDIVLIHGWGCDLRHMQPIVDLLVSNYRVTNIDLPGRGNSDWVPTIKTIHDIADIILPLQCPIDLILGEKDQSVPLASHAAMKQLNPAVDRSTTYVVLDASAEFSE